MLGHARQGVTGGIGSRVAQARCNRRTEQVSLVLVDEVLDLGIGIRIGKRSQPALGEHPLAFQLEALDFRLTDVGGVAGREQGAIATGDRAGQGQLLVGPVDQVDVGIHAQGAIEPVALDAQLVVGGLFFLERINAGSDQAVALAVQEVGAVDVGIEATRLGALGDQTVDVEVVGGLVAQGPARGEAGEGFIQRPRLDVGAGTEHATIDTATADLVPRIAGFQRGGPLVGDVPVHHAVDGLVGGLVVRIGRHRHHRAVARQHEAGQVAKPTRLSLLVVVVQAGQTGHCQRLVAAQAQVLRPVLHRGVGEGFKRTAVAAIGAVVLVGAGVGAAVVVGGGRGQRPVVVEEVFGTQAGAQEIGLAPGEVAGSGELIGIDAVLGRRLDIATPVTAVAVGQDRVQAEVQRTGFLRQVAVEVLAADGGNGEMLVTALLLHHAGGDVQLLGRRPGHGNHAADGLGTAQVLLLRGLVVEQAIIATLVDADVVAKGAVLTATGVEQAELFLSIVASAQGQLGARRTARTAGDEIHRAGEGATAIGGRLRATHHFHALDVFQAVAGNVAFHVDAVDEERGIGLALDVGHAADHRAVKATAVAGLEGEAGRQRGNVAHIDQALLFDGLLADGRDRQRHLLQRLGHAAGGDFDRFQAGDRAVGIGSRFDIGAFSGNGVACAEHQGKGDGGVQQVWLDGFHGDSGELGRGMR